MKVLIFGLGSIAQKHIAALKSIDKNVVFYALRSGFGNQQYNDVINISSLNELDVPIDFCIISNPTSLHYETIKEASKLNIPIFIEKPSLMNLEGAEELFKMLDDRDIISYVGFTLRFHPVIEFLKKHLYQKRILEVNIYCGSYLPDWRKGIDYRSNYSAKSDMGGGVHLDLLHEIDYALYLFGEPIETTSIRKRLSDLKIDSYDFAHYTLLYKKMVINIILNYYRKTPKRQIEIVLNDDIITGDLLSSTVKSSSGRVLFFSNEDILEIYKKQMKYFFKLIENNTKPMNSLSESLTALKICLKNDIKR